MKTKGLFICLVGTDGSGKSTQAQRLRAALAGRGIDARYVYARNVPLLFRPVLLLGNLLFLRGGAAASYGGRTSLKKDALRRHRGLARIFYAALLFDNTLQMAAKVALPLRRGESIVCDRYLYDTIITDIAPDLELGEEETCRLIERFRPVIPRPDVTVLIDVSEETAFRRKDDIPDIAYLYERRRRYLAAAERFGFITVDGERPVEEITREILEKTAAQLEVSG